MTGGAPVAAGPGSGTPGSGIPAGGSLTGVPTLGRLAASGPPDRLTIEPTGPPARRRTSRLALLPVAAVVVVGAIIAGILLARGGGRDDDLAAAAAQGTKSSTTTEAPPAKDLATTTTAAPTTTTTAAPLPAVALESPAELFLATEIRRRWELDPAAGSLAVTVTLTNRAAGSFRWHHDEIVPKAVAADASLVPTNPPAEVLQADPMFRWWYELAPGQTMTLLYTVAKQASWPAALDATALAAWEADRAAATAARHAEIMASNQLTDPLAAPVPVTPVPTSTAPTTPPPVTAPVTAPPQQSGGGGTQVVVVTSPPVTAPPAPTVSITGPAQMCAGQRSYLEGVASGAVSGVWSLPAFAVTDASWSPGAPTQYVEPNSSAVGGTYRASLQVVSGANVAATATFDFTVVDCAPAPSVHIVGPDGPVCAGYTSYFSGVASGATHGSWSLPEFAVEDASWSPDAPTQYVQPNGYAIGRTFTWTLTVMSATGKTATAQLSFTVVAC